MTPDGRKVAVAWLSVVSNTTLIVLKVVVGVLIGSVSVISEAIHSGVDLLASVIALFAVKSSASPADERHPFGHGKVENISGTIEALLIFLAAGWIVYEAAKKFVHPTPIEAPFWGVTVMLFSAVANGVISHLLFRVGRETESVALQADAWHLRTDVYTSVGVMVGLALIGVGDAILPHLGDSLHLIDPLAAMVVAGLIVKAAWKMTIKSARDLMDVNLPQEEAWIAQMLETFRPAVHGFHRMRTRRSGSTRFVDFHIFVDGGMSVAASHRLAHEISRRIQDRFVGSNVTVHVEPCNGNCDHTCRTGCLLSEAERQAVRRARADERD